MVHCLVSLFLISLGKKCGKMIPHEKEKFK
uniref:Uncharacterized protein n=1 Tax=Rhizophora mucronata TaxID=61149 RepID=A0A2P2NRQ1_RHIMU